MSDSLWPHGLYSPWNSPGQNTGVNSRSLLQGFSQPGDRTQISHTGGGFFTSWATLWCDDRKEKWCLWLTSCSIYISQDHKATHHSRTTKPHITPEPRPPLEVSLVIPEFGAASGTLAQECPLSSLLEHCWLKLVTRPHSSLKLRKCKSVIRGCKATHMDWETLMMNTPFR